MGQYICKECEQELKKYEINKFEKNKFFQYNYDEKIRELIIQYKFRDNGYLYKLFSILILENKQICNFIKKYDIIIPVPVHWKRKMERGYNQTELIANEISKNIGIKVENKILLKQKNIKPLSTMNAKERSKNICNVFIVKNKEKIQNKKILLFDDIYTTGNTYKECKKMLIKCGANCVGIFTIAKDKYKSKTKEI